MTGEGKGGFRSYFRAITRLETLATQASDLVAYGSWSLKRAGFMFFKQLVQFSGLCLVFHSVPTRVN